MLVKFIEYWLETRMKVIRKRSLKEGNKPKKLTYDRFCTESSYDFTLCQYPRYS